MNKLRQIYDVSQLRFGTIEAPGVDEAIIPQIVVDSDRLATDGLNAILMQGYANRQAVEKSFATGLVTFWSRSQRGLWVKGETSGNILRLRAVYTDCDYDSLLIDAEPAGPTCHTGNSSCFEF